MHSVLAAAGNGECRERAAKRREKEKKKALKNAASRQIRTDRMHTTERGWQWTKAVVFQPGADM